MDVVFLSKLDKTNSIQKSENEYILTLPEYDFSEVSFLITKPVKLLSTNKSTIKSTHFSIKSHGVFLTGITFETSIIVSNSDNFKITNCEIKKSKLSDGSLYFYSSKCALVENVSIHDSEKIPGIYLTQKSSAWVKNVEVHSLEETLVVCNSESKLYMHDSKLYKTKANAVYVSSDSHIEIENCKLWDSDYPAIFISHSTCRIENNEIKDVKQNGISINTVKTFIVSHNHITDVSGSAIAILDESEGEAHRNVVNKVGGNGIYVCGNSKLTAIQNKIFDNQFPGIAILMKSTAKLFRNEVSNIQYSGICVRGAHDVKIFESKIDHVQECGISISDTDMCQVVGNQISNCNIGSVEVYNDSRTKIKHNKISSIGGYAFLVYAGAKLKAKLNTILDVHSAMAKLSYKGGGYFVDNILSDVPLQKDGQTSANYYFKGNGKFQGVTNLEEKKSEDIIYEQPYKDTKSMYCLKCHTRPRNCFILDCSHRIFCEECAKEAVKNVEVCPLCRFPIIDYTLGFESGDDGLCVICSENKADCIIMPCGHMGFCEECLERWYFRNKTCPTCRAEPSFYKKIITDI